MGVSKPPPRIEANEAVSPGAPFGPQYLCKSPEFGAMNPSTNADSLPKRWTYCAPAATNNDLCEAPVFVPRYPEASIVKRRLCQGGKAMDPFHPFSGWRAPGSPLNELERSA